MKNLILQNGLFNFNKSLVVLFLTAGVAGLLMVASCSEEDPTIPSETTTGTVVISMAPDDVVAPWACRLIGGSSISSAGDSVLLNMEPGTYELAWGAWENCDAPLADTLSLASGETITFSHDYICFPPPPPPIEYRWLLDIEGTGADDIYAGGLQGSILHFDGTEWSLLDSGSTDLIARFWIDQDAIIWCCGYNGLVLSINAQIVEEHDLGLNEEFLAIGSYDGMLHVGGSNGGLVRWDGYSWEQVTGSIIHRDPEIGAPLDTLQMDHDIQNFTVISHHFLGGAYRLPDWDGSGYGMDSTQGFVLSPDLEFDWQLQPLGDDHMVEVEWVLCSTSDPHQVSNNWVGTSAGWLFQLLNNTNGHLEWEKYPVRISESANYGIRDIMMVDGGHLYLVTDGGRIVYKPNGGEAVVLHDQDGALFGIWGMGPDDFYAVGIMDAALLHCSHDPASGNMETEIIDLSDIWLLEN